MDAQAIKIDPEFRSLIPPLSSEEREQLEANIKAEGCRDPLVVWTSVEAKRCKHCGETFSKSDPEDLAHCRHCDHHYLAGDECGNCHRPMPKKTDLVSLSPDTILIDGHNRYEICQRHGIPFQTVDVKGRLFRRDDVKAWVIRNQFGRRNLTPFQRAELALSLEPLIAEKAQASYAANVGRPNKSSQKSDTISERVDTKRELAGIAGVSHDTIHKAKVIAAKAPEPVKEKLRSGDISINAAYTDIRRKEKETRREERRDTNRSLIASAPEPTKAGAKFATIVIDPPWDWGDEGDVDQMGRARPTYGTMPFEEIKALPVADLADDDCHIYLWITNRSLPKGFELLDAWGFRYVTCLTWCKPSIGMGNYFRGSTEQILFGVKGSQPLKRRDAGTWFTAPRGSKGHSSKPVESYELIESCSPGPFIEMFARSQRPGWVAWGAEA